MKITIVIICLSVFGVSCNSFMCGELSGEWKEQFERANATTVSVKAENIPCEFYYINVIITTKHIDTTAIHSIHKYLYNKKSKIGWQVLLVYNTEGQYLFSHRYNDSIYIQKGD